MFKSGNQKSKTESQPLGDRQEDYEFKVRLWYWIRFCLKPQQN